MWSISSFVYVHDLQHGLPARSRRTMLQDGLINVLSAFRALSCLNRLRILAADVNSDGRVNVNRCRGRLRHNHVPRGSR